MDEKEAKLRQQVANSRLVHLNEQIIFPLLQKNSEAAIAALCAEFKAKGTVDLAKVAYLTACRDLALELEAIARRGDHAVTLLDEYRNT